MPARRLRHFLLIFDHKRDRLRDPPLQFDDPTEAVEAYAQAERTYDQDDAVEVVLIGSDSIATVQRTHANYFADRAFERWVTSVSSSTGADAPTPALQ